MTVDTPASGIESLLPPSGTSYKSLHCQHTPTNEAVLEHIPSALMADTFCQRDPVPLASIDSPGIVYLTLIIETSCKAY